MATPRRLRAWLPIIGALALFALVAGENRGGFELLHPGTLLIIVLISLALAVGSLVRRKHVERIPPGYRTALVTLTVTSVALAGNALVLRSREAMLQDRWRALEETALALRAERLRSEFLSLLRILEEPIPRARDLAARNPRSGHPRTSAKAFEIIELLTAGEPTRREDLGITLYRGGRALAWSGRCDPLPRELLVLSIPSGTTKWVPVQRSGLWRLVALSRPWSAREVLLAVEMVVRSIYDDRIHESLFSRRAFRPQTDRITFADYRRPPVDLAEIFDAGGDVLDVTGADKPALHVALRAPDGSLVGHATLSGGSLGSARSELYSTHRTLGHGMIALAGLLLVGMALLPRTFYAPATPWREISKQGLRITAIWVYRLVLAAFPVKIEIGGRSLDDPGLFARSGALGLSGSPLDFLLTSIAVLATGFILSLTLTRLATTFPGVRRTTVIAHLGAAVLLAFLLGTYLPSAALSIVQNVSIDILTVKPFSPDVARVVLQSAAAFTLTGFVIVLVTLAWNALWAFPSRLGRGPLAPPLPAESTLKWLALLVVPSAVVACCLLELTLQPAATSVLKRFIEDQLATTVRAMPTLRRLGLRAALAAVEEYAALGDLIERAPPEGDPALAYDIWRATPVASRGNAASLTVRDAQGRLLSRFSRNFPLILDQQGIERADLPEGTIQEFETGPRERPVRALHAHTAVEVDGEQVGTVTFHLRDDFGDIPPLTPPSPLQRALGQERTLSPLLPSWSPYVGLAVYSGNGVPIRSTPRDPPPAPSPNQRRRILSDFREKLWVTREEEGYRVFDLFFSSANHLVALSFPEPGLLGRAARSVRYAVQTSALLLALLVPMGVAAALRLGWRPSPSRLMLALTRTHYRRLVSTFLLAALAPLALLAFALTEFITSEAERDITEHGLTSLDAARRRVEDIAVLEGDLGPPDDASLFGITQEAGDELSLFIRGELSASSNREIYDVGILPRRLNGRTYRQIAIEGRRVIRDSVEIGDRTCRTVNGVVSLGVAGDGVLTILLAGESPEIARRSQQVFDTFLIICASVILAMGVLAYAMARRIAAPIRSLSAASARIAGGDLHAEVSLAPRDETGDLVASFNAMARALRRQRDDLARRGNYIEKILLNATTGVVSIDLKGRIVTLNPAAVAILALPNLGAGQDLVERLSENPEFEHLSEATRACLASPTLPRKVEVEIGSGEEARYARGRIVPFTEGSGLLIFLDDVSETVRSNRLAAWAQMARRIAHEVKNPLTPIQLSADHIRRVYTDGSESFPSVLEECLRTINEQVTNLRAISSQFSLYARHPEMKKEPTPMREFLNGVIRPYRVAPPEGISVECDLTRDLPLLEIDRTMITQALVNLIENAVQAMPNGGRLIMSATVSGESEPRSLHVVIADTGVGMDREALKRVFEPYFSTKGAGIGLGMAIARRAIEEHRGRLELKSAPRKGTTARIILPMP